MIDPVMSCIVVQKKQGFKIKRMLALLFILGVAEELPTESITLNGGDEPPVPVVSVEFGMDGTLQVSSDLTSINVIGSGTLLPPDGADKINMNVIQISGEVKAKSLYVAQHLVITGANCSLSPVDGEQIELGESVTISLTSGTEKENPWFPFLDLGMIGSEYNIVPKTIDITTDGEEFDDEYEVLIVKGTNLTNCDKWQKNINFVNQVQSSNKLTTLCKGISGKTLADPESTGLYLVKDKQNVNDATLLILTVVIAVGVFVTVVVITIRCRSRKHERLRKGECSDPI